MSSTSIERSYIENTPLKTEKINAMRTEARAKGGKEKGRKVRTAAAAGVVIVAATVGVVKFGQKAWDSFTGTIAQTDQRAKLADETYSGRYAMPTENTPHRVIYAGQEYGKIMLGNVGAVAEYVHKRNPKISEAEVSDLVMAENTEFQRHDGVPAAEINPTQLATGPILLPPEYGVGTFVPGSDNSK